MRTIEAAEKIKVALDAVGVVDVVVEQEAQKVCLAAFGDTPEFVGWVSVVAGEPDLPDRELHALLDLEDQADTLVRARDRLWIDLHLEIAVLAVELGEAHDIVMHQRARERAAGLRLHGFLEVLVFDLLVALEGQAIDGRIFDNVDEDAVAVACDRHVRKEARGVKTLQRSVDGCGIKRPVGRGVKEPADHVGVGVPIAADGDRRIHRRRLRVPARCEGKKRQQRQAEKSACHPTRHQRGSATQHRVELDAIAQAEPCRIVSESGELLRPLSTQ